MEINNYYWKVSMETQNPSADDCWNFRTEQSALSFIEKKKESIEESKKLYGEDYYGDITFTLTEERIGFED